MNPADPATSTPAAPATAIRIVGSRRPATGAAAPGAIRLVAGLALLAAAGCGAGDAETGDAETAAVAAACPGGDPRIELPPGFCAQVVSDGIPGARHIDVAPNGEVYVARRNRRENNQTLRGGVTVLRDTDGDGRSDERADWGENGGNEVLVADGFLYFAPDDAVLRYPLEPGSMEPAGPPDTIVAGLPADRNHAAKSLALGEDGSLYVNIGAPSNACMTETRTAESPGMDPCPELDTRAGIWRFSADRVGQTQADGTRFATGLRNTVALRMHPGQDVLYGVIHGRDQLDAMWPDVFGVAENTEMPSEELVRITEGSDFGWPYCFHDPRTGRKLLAPEYGGDGETVGRCEEMDPPIIGFPAHWAPNDLEFYAAEAFPERYRGGAFIAFHGSWNRAPNPQEGFQVAFVPASSDGFGPDWETFADGFRNEQDESSHARPVGLAVGPEGALYVSESVNGRIWRISYRGS